MSVATPVLYRSFAALLDRLRSSSGAAAFSLYETGAAARPYLLSGIFKALGDQMLVVVPTADVAERTFADLLYYLGEGENGPVALMRPRDESIGALESPSERSARMTLLADLCARRSMIVVAPVAALRQYLMPREVFESLVFSIERGTSAGFEETQQRLFTLGYHRVDVVGAAGEYAVRGGLIDVFAATAEKPVRIEFFGDDVESIRPFDLQSQRSDAGEPLATIAIAPWGEIPRDAIYRERVSERVQGEPGVVSAVRAYLASGAEVPEAWLSLAYDRHASVFEYLSKRALVVLEEPQMLATIDENLSQERSREQEVLLAGVESGELDVRTDEVGEALLADVSAPYPNLRTLRDELAQATTLVIAGAIEGDAADAWMPRILERFALETRPVDHFQRRMDAFMSAVREWMDAGDTVWLTVTGASRLHEMLQGAGIDAQRGMPRALLGNAAAYVDQGSIDAGFSIPALRLHVLGDREIYGQPQRRVKLRAVKEGVPVTLSDLSVGDFVVHAVHGIGQYLGLRTETILGTTSDYLDLQYAGNDRMLVPVHQMHMVTKYNAGEGVAPRLSRMGGADWARAKGRVSEQLAKIADDLVALYAERESAPGYSFGPDAPWQSELEEAFPYTETPDQLKAINEVKGDMSASRPMDRLVCGDVGYGKTEVAIRAAFKAVLAKKQVAILVPTTLLAAQHFRTFSARFASFPVQVAELSRFRTKKEQQAILRDVADGKVDIVIGTHRLLQKDVVFKDLGLLVIDEEQRFGVMHKERLKQLRASVDVLTLSATPIPRTLHMSLLGVRDLSLIQTAPANRLSTKTVVVPSSDSVVQRAIMAELDRGGQVYYVHNRIETIYAVAKALEQLVPKARIGIGHGQMNESELEPVMQRFIDGEVDVFVSTTIIENGLDIPNVNTIVISDADKFGLGDLYQLRGRVGRSNQQAYAYLLYQAHKALTEEAKARLEAIREFTHLGSGMQIAMRDLEIRGAGNLLGKAQSGFIGAVGFETYCSMLADAIAERRGRSKDSLEQRREAVIDIKIDAFIPADYIPQVSQKIAVYQQLAAARSEAEVEEIAAGVRDRFGAFPDEFRDLVEITKLRTIALRKNITRVVIDERRLTFGVGSGFALEPSAIPRLQSLTKNRFRFGDGKITIDLPTRLETPRQALPLVRQLVETV
ncbi:MAG TPA: transcription-repair coupling factor [Candidatus Acidoferrales bacterium]|nr:transcription-repair coupling factor [Candidatus Acidoferrales bacterium]